MQIKGGLLRARFLYVALNHGPEVWERVQARLSESDRQSLADIDIDDWYDLALLDRLDQAIAAELAGAPREVFEALGEYSATTSLSGPYRSLLNPDIHSFLNQSALIHRTYQDFGQAAYEEISPNSGLLKIKYETPPPESFCVSGSAYFRRAVELCGASGVRIVHPLCCANGDPLCEFYITWQG